MRRRFSAKQKAQIVLEILREEKTIAQMASEYGVHPTQLHRWKKQALERLPELFERDDRQERVKAAAHERQLEDLYAQIGRLTAQVNWLKENLASTFSRNERLAMIERTNASLSLSIQAELLSLSRSSLY